MNTPQPAGVTETKFLKQTPRVIEHLGSTFQTVAKFNSPIVFSHTFYSPKNQPDITVFPMIPSSFQQRISAPISGITYGLESAWCDREQDGKHMELCIFKLFHFHNQKPMLTCSVSFVAIDDGEPFKSIEIGGWSTKGRMSSLHFPNQTLAYGVLAQTMNFIERVVRVFEQ